MSTTTKSEFNMILDILWDDSPTAEPNTVAKAKAFRRVLVAALQKELKPELPFIWENPVPPTIDQKKVANVRARAWNAFQKQLKPELPDKIIVLILKPLERRVSRGSEKETDNSILSLANEEGKLYTKENDSSLMVYRDEESWKVSFRTFLPKLAGKSVLLVITDSQGELIMSETQKLEEDKDDEVWEFECPLPKHMKRVESHTIEIRYPDEQCH